MNPATDLATLLEGYRLSRTADGRSPQTTRWYLSKLRIFKRYLEETGGPTDVTRIGVSHIRAFLVHLRSQVKADQNNPNKHARDEPLSGLTIQGYVRTLKAFYSWVVRKEYRERNPMRRIKTPRTAKVIIDTFTNAQIRTLLSAVDVSKPLG